MDPITAEFFSGRIQVDDRDGLLTQHLNTIEIRDLAGAPDESLVKVRRSGRGYGVILETTSRYLAVPFKVYLGGPVAGAVIQNDHVELRNEWTNKGIGVRAAALQITTARKLKVHKITATAAGSLDMSGLPSDPLRGYHIWPRLGYEAPIPSWLLPCLPSHLRGATLLSELMADLQGQALWKSRGMGVDVWFYPQDQAFWQRFQMYLAQRKIAL